MNERTCVCVYVQTHPNTLTHNIINENRPCCCFVRAKRAASAETSGALCNILVVSREIHSIMHIKCRRWFFVCGFVERDEQ